MELTTGGPTSTGRMLFTTSAVLARDGLKGARSHVAVWSCVQSFPREGADSVLLELERCWRVEPSARIADRVAENHHLARPRAQA